jgi:predicted nucleic acid-binding protein
MIDMNTILKASFLRKTYILSYWDSLIMASALENDCSVLYSEDMQHGQILEGRLKIINPFV